MKKILPILAIGTLILSGTGTVALPTDDIEMDLQWKTSGINQASCNGDELDQYQLEWDWFGPVGRFFLTDEYFILAQSFIPTKNTLTKVELMAAKNITATYDYTVAIRDDLNGADLTSVNVPSDVFLTDNFSWIEFDFDDIAVTPGSTYYIVSSTVNETDNWYGWAMKIGDVYPNGTVFFTTDDGATWEEEPGGDMTFMTYGMDNSPPETPTIDGPTNGRVGQSLDYIISTTDPDGDQVYYWVEWFQGCPGVDWDGPHNSDDPITRSHTYDEQGTYTIGVKAKDIYGAESDWATLDVTIPRNRASARNMFYWLFEGFPNIFSIFKNLLPLLGL